MSATIAVNPNPTYGSNGEPSEPQSYAELSARLRTLLRLQNVAKLLLAGGPGDFWGKREAARLAQERGMAKLKARFERVRESFRASFEPIIMEIYRDAPRSLPWFEWWGQPCEKQDLFEFALIHASTLACREITFFRKVGVIVTSPSKDGGNDFLVNLEPDAPKLEADFYLAGLEFDSPTRKLLQAEITPTLDSVAKEFGFQTAKRAEQILSRRSRDMKSVVQLSWLQRLFLDYWDRCPRVDGKLLCGANGAPFSPLCYFDDKSTTHIIQALARETSGAPSEVKSITGDAVNKTWRRLGLVRVRKPEVASK